MRLALLQINPTVGDLAGNAQLIADAVRQAEQAGADLAITPELVLVGYPSRDLLLGADFVRRSWEALSNLASELAGPGDRGFESRLPDHNHWIEKRDSSFWSRCGSWWRRALVRHIATTIQTANIAERTAIQR